RVVDAVLERSERSRIELTRAERKGRAVGQRRRAALAARDHLPGRRAGNRRRSTVDDRNVGESSTGFIDELKTQLALIHAKLRRVRFFAQSVELLLLIGRLRLKIGDLALQRVQLGPERVDEGTDRRDVALFDLLELREFRFDAANRTVREDRRLD